MSISLNPQQERRYLVGVPVTIFCEQLEKLKREHPKQSMIRTLAILSKAITMPKLSPTHTQSRIIKWLATEGQTVNAYDLILQVECSSDMVTEAYRESPNERKVMVIDTQEEGILRDLTAPSDQWIDVGTQIGIIYEEGEEEFDGPWTWQAYLKGDD